MRNINDALCFILGIISLGIGAGLSYLNNFLIFLVAIIFGILSIVFFVANDSKRSELSTIGVLFGFLSIILSISIYIIANFI